MGARRGYDELTLTTFADVPFNAPWYQRLGFRVVQGHDAVGPELAGIVDQERDLTRLGTRVVMSIWTHRSIKVATTPDSTATSLSFSSNAGRWVLAATVLGSGMAAIDATVVGIALPDIGAPSIPALASSNG